MVKAKSSLRPKTQDVKPLIKAIRNIPDFPKPGILFRDITPLLSSPKLLQKTINHLASSFKKGQIDYIVGIESRGFLLAAPLAYKLDCGLVPVRKAGKLPAKTVRVTYDLEYGQDTLEIHADAFSSGQQILIVDDVLATGGTAQATAKLVEQAGGKVIGLSFLIELEALKGRNKLASYPIHSLIKF